MLSLKKYLPNDIFSSQKLKYISSIAGGIYLLFSTLSYLRGIFKKKKETNQLINFINKEKEKISNLDYTKYTPKEKSELCCYFYYITINQFYSKQFSDFDIQRRACFDNSLNLNKYIACVEKFHKTLRDQENDIFELIFKTLNFDSIEFDTIMNEVNIEYFLNY